MTLEETALLNEVLGKPTGYCVPVSTLNMRRTRIAQDIVRRVDTVTLTTCEEVADIYKRAHAGEFDTYEVEERDSMEHLTEFDRMKKQKEEIEAKAREREAAFGEVIAGYRTLTPEEIALINTVKQHGELLGDLIAKLEQIGVIDKRWLAIAKTEAQKANMFLVRAIARPDNF